MEGTSFIIARDPSILAWNRPKINPALRTDLCSNYSDSETSTASSLKNIPEEKETHSDHLEVYLRIKPLDNNNSIYEYNENVLKCRVPTGSQVLRSVQDGSKFTKQFSFTKIYGPEVDQSEIFNDCLKRKVLNFINGRNSTIFAYGTSGSGKTFTILGTAENPGIIPRSLEYLFRTIPPVSDIPKVKPTQSGNGITVLDTNSCIVEEKARNKILNLSSSTIDKSLHIQTYKTMQTRLSAESNAILAEKADVTVGVWVSFTEVYNEYVYDLLQEHPGRGNQRPKLRLAQDIKGNTYVKDITNISVSSGLEAYEILQYGMHNLNYAPTSVNAHSSRSHCIFTIKLVQLAADSNAQVSHFNFCDLAGSERVKSTQNVGDRLKESNNINTSLHVLGRCIKSIRDSQKCNDSRLIPFRESKLTRLFQRALSGQESIAMVVNINASKEMFDESQHVLNFSAIAKCVTIDKEVKQETISTNKRFSQYIHNRNKAFPNQSSRTENDILREQVVALSLQLEIERQQYSEKELTIRHEIVTVFQERNKQTLENCKRRMDEEKQGIINLYEFKMDKLTTYYENEKSVNAKRARISHVIELDSTLNDEVDDLRHTIQIKTLEINQIRSHFDDSQKRNNSLQAEKSQIEFQLSAQKTEMENDKNKIQVLTDNNLKLIETNIKLEQLIKDAEVEFREIKCGKEKLQQQLEEKTLEVFQLEAEIL